VAALERPASSILQLVTNVDGVERLTVDVTWVNQHRDRVEVLHISVGCPTQLVVKGRSSNDLMKTIAAFLDYTLECTEDSFVFKFKQES
jgi:hypothetical protein